MKKQIMLACLALSFSGLAKQGCCSLIFSSSVQVDSTTALAFSPNDACVVTANVNNTLSVLPFNRCTCSIGAPTTTVSFGSQTPLSVAFSPSGNCLAVYTAGSVGFPPSALYLYSFDQTTCTLTTTPTQIIPLASPLSTVNQPQALAFSPDGSFLAFADLLGNVVDIFAFSQSTCSVNPVPLQVIPINQFPLAITFSHDGTRLAVTGGGLGVPGFVAVYTLIAGQYIQTQPNMYTRGVTPLGVAFSPHDCCLAVSNFLSTGNNVSFFKVCKGTLEFQLIAPSGGNFPIGIEYSPDGRCLAVTNANGSIGLFTMKKKRCVPCLFKSVPAGPSGTTNTAADLQYSHNGRCLAVANYLSDNVSVFKTSCCKKGN